MYAMQYIKLFIILFFLNHDNVQSNYMAKKTPPPSLKCLTNSNIYYTTKPAQTPQT